MRAAMDQFAANAEAAEEVVIYYSGHAMRMEGRTFFAPIDFNPVGPVAVVVDGAPGGAVRATGSKKPCGAVLFLYAAQLTGFAPTSFADPGVAPIELPEVAFIVSAAEPNRAIRRSRWRMSAFAQSVVEDFLAEGADVMTAASNADGAIWTTGVVDPGIIFSPPLQRRQQRRLTLRSKSNWLFGS